MHCHTYAGNPLPNVIHKYIRKSDLAPGRLVIVGDVHGCLSELFQLLDALDFKFGHDNLLLTGDMVNKGPRSQEVGVAELALVPQWNNALHDIDSVSVSTCLRATCTCLLLLQKP